jgi:hypothetical protein
MQERYTTEAVHFDIMFKICILHDKKIDSDGSAQFWCFVCIDIAKICTVKS